MRMAGVQSRLRPACCRFSPRNRVLSVQRERQMPDEAGFGRRADGPTGRRRALRERMPLAVSLYAVDQSRVALLADISESGCRLQGIGLPEVGQDVLLKAVDVELFGRVVWKDDR